MADILWTAHYSLLGAWSGAAVCGIGILRETVFLNKHRKWADSKLWLAFFFLLSIVSASLTWKNAFSILPACASALSILSFWIGKPKLTRVLQLPISISFLIYNIVSLSYTGMVNEVMTLSSLAVAWLRNSGKTTGRKAA